MEDLTSPHECRWRDLADLVAGGLASTALPHLKELVDAVSQLRCVGVSPRPPVASWSSSLAAPRTPS